MFESVLFPFISSFILLEFLFQITITPNQLNLLRMGLGNGANTSPAQQVIIPTIQTQQAPIVQVTSNQQPNTSNIYLGTNQHQQQSLHEDKNKNIANQFRRNC